MCQDLRTAEEIWISVALLKIEGYNFIKTNIGSSNHRQHWLVGIDLPTDPDALTLLAADCPIDPRTTGILFRTQTFHPKVYVFRVSNQLRAYVGSANITMGGLHHNTEMALFTDEQDVCQDLIHWFDQMFWESFPLSEENIRRYAERYSQSKNIRERQLEEILTMPPLQLSNPQNPHAGINFSKNYFSKEDHLAFSPDITRDRSHWANIERGAVSTKLYELHNNIYPQFSAYGLVDLQPNSNPFHIVSSDRHTDWTGDKIKAMWLSYGKSPEEVTKYQELFEDKAQRAQQTFSHHARLQIKIDYNSISIWLLLGKKNGSLYDRSTLRNSLRDERYAQTFFNHLKSLPEEFYMQVSGERRFISAISSTSDLLEFSRRDRPDQYYFIGKTFQLHDPAVEAGQLPRATLQEFSRLYPLYHFMRDKSFYSGNI